MEGRLLSLLRALCEARVEFILVGGLSGVLQGAPIVTEDVDIVHSREPGNLQCLLALLERLDAVYRIYPERKLRPTLGHLASAGHQNLTTRFGWLDLLGTVGDQLGYPDLLPHSHWLEIADGVGIRVLDLEMYIRLKEQLAGDKDLAVLPTLRQTLRERRKRGE